MSFMSLEARGRACFRRRDLTREGGRGQAYLVGLVYERLFDVRNDEFIGTRKSVKDGIRRGGHGNQAERPLVFPRPPTEGETKKKR